MTQWKDLIVYQPNQDHFCYNVIQYYNKTREPSLLTYPEMSRITTFWLHFFIKLITFYKNIQHLNKYTYEDDDIDVIYEEDSEEESENSYYDADDFVVDSPILG